jgi:hypothetical protein
MAIGADVAEHNRDGGFDDRGAEKPASTIDAVAGGGRPYRNGELVRARVGSRSGASVRS